jgi:hypothetical protein
MDTESARAGNPPSRGETYRVRAQASPYRHFKTLLDQERGGYSSQHRCRFDRECHCPHRRGRQRSPLPILTECPEVIAYLQNKTGKQLQIGRLGVSLLPTLSIRLYDFGVKNPTPFPPGYFLSAPTVTAEIDAAALLHRQIAIKSVVLDDPVINVISDPDGLWNFENG